MKPPSCLFCEIVEKRIPADIIFEDNDLLAFKDIHPVAPQHYLLIPKQHLTSLNEFNEDHIFLGGKLLYRAAALAKELKFDEEGYRLVSNCQTSAGQSVFHLHFHLLAGRNFHWPPG